MQNTTTTEEFVKFPKMARLSREVIISEKIDGTNAQVFIKVLEGADDPGALVCKDGLAMYAGSRTRWITPTNDNFGFAKWVVDHADDLFLLGPGRHFGEWWGSGIQRGYGLAKGERRWSLFNTVRWCLHGSAPERIAMADPRIEKWQDVLPACCGLVPVLYRGIFDTLIADEMLADLRRLGSKAAPGFMNPEGIVVFHTAANVGFKKTIEKDDTPKSEQ
jgi:hypothetical protein